MHAWSIFWGWFLAAVLVVFAALAIVVAIGGFFDVKSLLAKSDEPPEHEPTHLGDDSSET